MGELTKRATVNQPSCFCGSRPVARKAGLHGRSKDRCVRHPNVLSGHTAWPVAGFRNREAVGVVEAAVVVERRRSDILERP
jgi:hypothetical protein